MTYTIVRDNSYILTEEYCPECGGSGVRRGEVECFDCGGQGSWEATCADCMEAKPLNAHGVCVECAAEQWTSVVSDPLFPLGNETLPNAVKWQDFARSGKAA